MTDFSHFAIVEPRYHFRLANAVSESPGSYMQADRYGHASRFKLRATPSLTSFFALVIHISLACDTFPSSLIVHSSSSLYVHVPSAAMMLTSAVRHYDNSKLSFLLP